MGNTLKETISDAPFQVVAEGPIQAGPQFDAPRQPDMSWRAFYDAERSFRREPAAFERSDGYDQLHWVTRHAVLDADGRPVTPVISELAIFNEGYIITWTEVFWREGFCLYKGQPAFVSIGKDEGYATFGGYVRLVASGAGVEVDRAGLEAHLAPAGEYIDGAQVAALAGLLKA